MSRSDPSRASLCSINLYHHSIPSLSSITVLYCTVTLHRHSVLSHNTVILYCHSIPSLSAVTQNPKPSIYTNHLYPHFSSHSEPSLCALTLYQYSPSFCTIPPYSHSTPSLYTIPLHCHSIPSLYTIPLHHPSTLSLYTVPLHHPSTMSLYIVTLYRPSTPSLYTVPLPGHCFLPLHIASPHPVHLMPSTFNRFSGLRPETRYAVVVRDIPHVRSSFKTFPAHPTLHHRLKFAVTACNNVWWAEKVGLRPEQDVWRALITMIDGGEVDMALHLGDQVYGDSGLGRFERGAQTKEETEKTCIFLRALDLVERTPRSHWEALKPQIIDMYREV